MSFVIHIFLIIVNILVYNCSVVMKFVAQLIILPLLIPYSGINNYNYIKVTFIIYYITVSCYCNKLHIYPVILHYYSLSCGK